MPTGHVNGALQSAPAAEIPEEAKEVQTQALSLVEEARGLVVGSDEQFQAAGEFLTTRVKAMLKEIAEVFDPIVKAAHEAHRKALAGKRRVELPVLEAEKVVKTAIGAYHRKRNDERRRAEAEALRRAREEAETRRLEEAAHLESEGRREEAEALIEEPVAAVAPAADKGPAAAGVSVRTVHDFRVVNVAAMSRRFLMPDEKKIRQTVKAMGADAAEIVGGIEVYERSDVAARAR